jgi:hypothetical protein
LFIIEDDDWNVSEQCASCSSVWIEFPTIWMNAKFFTANFIADSLKQTEIHIFYRFDDRTADLGVLSGFGDHWGVPLITFVL